MRRGPRPVQTVQAPGGLMNHNHAEIDAMVPPNPALGWARQPSVRKAAPLLLVDDEAAPSRMQRRLTATGFAVTGVRSAAEALDAAASMPFTHAVVELRLGRDSGLGLIAELRALRSGLRIVVVTGFDSFASVILALRAGPPTICPSRSTPASWSARCATSSRRCRRSPTRCWGWTGSPGSTRSASTSSVAAT